MSLIDEIDSDFIANSIRMVKIEGYYILLEGETDELVFSKFFKSENVSFEICHGKENLLSAIKILNVSKCQQNYLGIVDKDLDHFLESHSIEDNILETDFHDLEIMCFTSNAFKSFAIEYYSKNKIERFKNIDVIKDHIRDLALQVSKLRLINFQNKYNLKFKPNLKNKENKELDYTKFICKKDFKFLGYDTFLDSISKYYNQGLPKDKNLIKKEIQELDINNTDVYSLIHGHDLTSIISLSLKSVLGKSSVSNSKRDDVERAIRLAYSLDDFKDSKLYQKIISIDASLLN